MVTHRFVRRQPPSGPRTSIAGTMAIASTAVALTAAATATGTLSGARTGSAILITPRTNLLASLAIAFSRVVSDDTIVVGFTNVGPSTNTGAMTFDVEVSRITNQ